MKIPKEHIKTIAGKGYMDRPISFRVYLEANGLALGHSVGHTSWKVIHLNTLLPIECPAKINVKAKTKVLKFFEYLVSAPFAWGDWKGQDQKPTWSDQARAYRDGYRE